jgi:uncharacterized protein with HEPN domain
VSSSPPRLDDYLGHMLAAIERIGQYTEDQTLAGFLNDPKTQDAVIRNLEILGEAARNIERRYPEFAAKHPEVPWSVAYEMRNVLAHGYFQVDLNIVWATLERDLPDLAAAMRHLRQ